MIQEERLREIEGLLLESGAHDGFDEGMLVLTEGANA